MMQAMRERVKIIYWVVITTFVGLMFLVWGIGDWNSPANSTSGDVVAVIGNVEIPTQLWRERTNAIRDQMRARQGGGQNLTETEILRARDQAFEEIVTETLMRQQAEDFELRVTDEEIADILQNSPPPSLLSQFLDADGNPDYEAYYRALQSQNFPWNQIVRSMRATLPLQKLQQRIAAQALVSDAELRQVYSEQTVAASVEYLGMKFSDVEIEETEPTAEEIQAWYDSHVSDYEQPARTRVRLVRVEKAPSEEDEAEILSILGEIRADIVAGRQSFEEAARIYSEDTSSDSGGDLGFFDRERMVEPFTEAAFALSVGDVSMPVRTQFGYHIIECLEETLDDSGQRSEMRARHILLKARPSQATLDTVRERVHGAREKAEAVGLEAAATEFSYEVAEPESFQEGFNIPGVPSSLPGSRFAHQNDAGALSPVYETEEQFYFVEVAERIPAGHRPLDEVRSQVIAAISNDRRAEEATRILRTAIESLGADEPLESAASGAGLSYAITDTFTLRENIQEIGFATPFARAALSANTGDLLEEVTTRDGVYALRVLYKSDFDENGFRASRANIARNLNFSRSRTILQQWLEERRAETEIIDRRDEIL